jgi:hypothetical protein
LILIFARFRQIGENLHLRRPSVIQVWDPAGVASSGDGASAEYFFRHFPILRIDKNKAAKREGDIVRALAAREGTRELEDTSMCDYSLHGLPNRLAVEGEGLVTYRFRTGSVGLATPTEIAAANRPKPRGGCRRSWWSALKERLDPQMELDQVPAVCIPPGAHLLMNHIPEELKRKFALQAVEDVTFVQLSADVYCFRDGIRFRSGKQVLLQEITEGVRFEVLLLASSQRGRDAEPQRVPDPILDCLMGKAQ